MPDKCQNRSSADAAAVRCFCMKMQAFKILLALLIAAVAAQASPPRMHSERGTVKAVDPQTQTITLQVCCDTKEFVWQDWTRIRIDGKKVAPENIAPATPVRVSYRHEAGLQSLYEVRSIEASRACGTDCVTCAR
jgi:hypothetical protein